MENGAFAPNEQNASFSNIFKYLIFQRLQKALLWSKDLMLWDGLCVFDLLVMFYRCFVSSSHERKAVVVLRPSSVRRMYFSLNNTSS